MTSPETSRRWGFIGGGRMATALIRGMIRSKTADPSAICASDPLEPARSALGRETGIAVHETNEPVARASGPR